MEDSLFGSDLAEPVFGSEFNLAFTPTREFSKQV